MPAAAAIVDGKKRCARCKQMLPLDQFGARKDRNGRPWSYCRPCGAEDADRRKEQLRRSRYKLRYGITIEDFERMLVEQRRACATCGREVNETTAHIDHDHTTGKVRGLLCGPCNRAIGLMQDSAEVLAAAARYLEQHQHTTVAFPPAPKRLDLPLAG